MSDPFTNEVYLCRRLKYTHIKKRLFDSSFLFSSQMSEWKTLEKLQVRQRQRCILCEMKGQQRRKVEIVLLGSSDSISSAPLLAFSTPFSLSSRCQMCVRENTRESELALLFSYLFSRSHLT